MTIDTDAPALYDPNTYAKGVPHEYYRWLRDNDPVAHLDHPTYTNGYWVITRHAEVQQVSRDATTFRNAPDPFEGARRSLGLTFDSRVDAPQDNGLNHR